MAIKVTFLSASGDKRWDARATTGDRLLEVGQGVDVPLEGACEGAMACSTCHVLVDEAWAGKLPAPSDEELDMLDFAYGVGRTSRLACQLRLTEALDGLVLHLPQAARNMMRR
jgi:ferredoxin-2, mitochondrial